MNLEKNLNKILIIDYGSQFTQLIARRIRELGVYSKIISHNKIVLSEIENNKVGGLILSGGPLNVYRSNKIKFDKRILSLGIPILGICFGHQILSKKLGGKVKSSKYREFGLATIKKKNKSLLTRDFFNNKNTCNVWMSHSDEVFKLPKGFSVIGSTRNSKFAMIENLNKKMFGIQFHPEVTHTKNGKKLLKNFVFSICKLKKNWSSKRQKSKLVNEVKNQVKNSKVIWDSISSRSYTY